MSLEFDYQKYTSGGLTVSQIDLLLNRLIEFKFPKIPIPGVGCWIELSMLALQVAAIVKLVLMRKERVDLELLVATQLHQQNTHNDHDDDVIN